MKPLSSPRPAPATLSPADADQLAHRNLLTKEQATAWKSGNDVAARAADDRALAQAILASLEAMDPLDNPKAKGDPHRPADPPSGGTTSTKTTKTTKTATDTPTGKAPATSSQPTGFIDEKNMADYKVLQLAATERLETWLHLNGFDIVSNTGSGENNCLIISLVQHAKKDYSSEHLAEVRDIRQALVDHCKGRDDPQKKLGQGDQLPGSGADIDWLVNQINDQYGRNMRVAVVCIGTNNEPTYHHLGGRKSGEVERVMIFDKSGHFEAVVPRGTLK